MERDQSVRTIVFLPVGAKVILHREIEYKLRDISYHGCWVNYPDNGKQKYTEWVMTKTGLVCTQKPPVTEPDNEESVQEEDNQQDSVIQIDGSSVTTIEVKDKKLKISTKES